MKAYMDQMERLGYPITLVLGVNMILTSLSKDYDQSNQKPKSQARGKGKQRGKGKSKLAYDPKHKIPPPPSAKREHPAKDTECHYCHKTGHWKRNCPLYLAELKKNKASASGTSGIFTIELFSFPKSNTWIYDTGCGTHICNTIQGLRGYRKLNKGALDLYVGNGHSAAVEAIGSFELILPSGMILILDNCHFSPSIRGIVSLSRLWDKGFRYEFLDNGVILVSKDNICYFNAFPRDGIFEIDMHNHISNERSIYTCSNKKTKHNLDSTFLWHCRLGHINKNTALGKIQLDGLLNQLNDESLMYVYSVYWQNGKKAIHSCKSTRISQTPERYGFYIDVEEHKLGYHSEPPNYRAALSDLKSEKWLEAMNAEMQSMKDNEVWNLVDLPPNCKNVGSKWLFKKKTDMDGNIHTYKARLVSKVLWLCDLANGCQTALLLNVALSETFIWCIHEGFVKYNVHPGYEYASFKDPFMDLSKLLGAGTRDLMRRSKRKETNSNTTRCKILAWKMFCHERLRMDNSKRGTIPMQPNVDLSNTQGPSTPAEVNRMKGIPYASVVGSIMYAVRCTRPDIAFSQNLTSRCQQNPGESHWTAVKNILKYLRNTKDMFTCISFWVFVGRFNKMA
ncbi:retrotransposon protein, putative, ty1-copia subclass [Tanacetum coccineum]